MVTPNVTLRPASLADLDAFEQRFDSAADTGPFQWFGHTSMQRLHDVWEERRLLRGDHNLLAVEADGELAGRVDYFEKTWRIRRAQWRGGRWHDQVLLSVLRDEWRDEPVRS